VPDEIPKLVLDPVTGPEFPRIELIDGERHVMGRSSDADIRLVEDTVSRRHAAVEVADGEWTVTDLGSRHGTFVNTARLASNVARALHDGDLMRIGPWTFRVRIGERRYSTVRTTDDTGGPESQVALVPPSELRSLAQHRLELLIRCSAQINAAEDEVQLGESVLSAALEGTGYARGAFVRPEEGTAAVSIVAFQGPSGERGEALTISRSLVAAAATGELARLEGGTQSSYGQSIVSLDIHSAMCAPVRVDGSVSAFVYLDARGTEAAVRSDAAEFCSALADMSGMALANLRTREVRERQVQLNRDLDAAHRAQKMLLPKPTGTVGGVCYAVRMEPGRRVAGDLFDVVELPDGRVAVFLGDVTGKGVGASLLMATTQTRLNLALTQFGDAAQAVREVNRYLTAHTAEELFVSLWVGLFDPRNRAVSFVDAGHGWWLLRPREGSAVAPESEGGLLLGVSATAEYEADTITLEPGTRVVVFSDGVVEQPGPSGEQFGRGRAIAALSDSPGTGEDVETLFEAVRAYRGETPQGDDVTIASIGLCSDGDSALG